MTINLGLSMIYSIYCQKNTFSDNKDSIFMTLNYFFAEVNNLKVDLKAFNGINILFACLVSTAYVQFVFSLLDLDSTNIACVIHRG